jgi:hypothetical protein
VGRERGGGGGGGVGARTMMRSGGGEGLWRGWGTDRDRVFAIE